MGVRLSGLMKVLFVVSLLLPFIVTSGTGDSSAQELGTMKLKEMSSGDKVSFAGRTWIVLNPEEGFIFAEDSLGNRAFDTTDNHKFSPEDATNIGYFLNHDYYGSLTAQEQNVIQEREWTLVPEYGDTNYDSVMAKIGLLSVLEWNTYKSVIDTPPQLMWLRTPSPSGFVGSVGTSGSTGGYLTPSHSPVAVRPALTLDPEMYFTVPTKPLKEVAMGSEFTFAGTTWIVLDPAKGYVLMKGSLGNMPFDTNNTDRFNPEEEGNIGYYLNSTFYHEAFTTAEQSMILEREWTLEDQNEIVKYPSVYAKVGLLSEKEWNQFNNELNGLSTLPVRSWFRTPRNYWPDDSFVRTVLASGDILQLEASNPFNLEVAVRPTLTIDPESTFIFVSDALFVNVIMTPNGNDSWAQSHSVTVDVTNHDTTQPLQYAWSQASGTLLAEEDWATLINGSSMTSPDNVTGTYYFHMRGTAGTTPETGRTDFHIVSNAFNIDNISPSTPTIQASTERVNDKHMISITHGDDADSGVAGTRYRMGNGEWHRYSDEWRIETEGETTIQAETMDVAGNRSEIVEKTVKIDKTMPEVHFETNGHATPMKEGSTKVTVTDEGGSGLHEDLLTYIWSENDDTPSAEEGWKTFENGDVLTKSDGNGPWYLHIQATDQAGNMMNDRSSVFHLDHTAPDIQVTMMHGDANTIYESDTWVNESVKLSVQADDTHSGIRMLTIKVNDDPLINAEDDQYAYLFENDGIYQVSITAVDEVGNENTEQCTIKISQHGLQLYSSLKYVDGHDHIDEWSNRNVIASFHAENLNGVTVTDAVYSVDAGVTWQDYIAPLVFSKEGHELLQFKAVDEAGNEIEEELNINIDKSAPVVTFLPNGNDDPASTVSTVVTVNDAGSGVDASSLQYVWTLGGKFPGEEAEWTVFDHDATLSHSGQDGEWYVNIRAADVAGNVEHIRSKRFILNDPFKRNARLSQLRLDTTSVQGFKPKRTEYQVNVANDKTSVTLVPTAEVETATITAGFQGEAHSTVQSDTPSQPFDLRVGDNILEVIVTAENGETMKTYQITIKRAASENGDEDEPDQGDPPAPSPPRSSFVPSTDGQLELFAGQAREVSLGDAIVISIPAGAVDKDMTLTIKEVKEEEGILTQDEVLASPIFEVSKSIADHFLKPITITIAFDETVVIEGQTVGIFYYDDMQQVWNPISERVEDGSQSRINTNTITVEAEHLAKMAVFVIDQNTGLPVTEEDDDLREVGSEVQFSDLSGHWAETFIKQAAMIGIISGYSDGTFQPDQKVSRVEFTVMVMNALQPDFAGDLELGQMFSDHEAIGAWALESVKQAVQLGIIHGYTKDHRATEHRSSKVTGANPVWEGANHTTNNESWSLIGNNGI